MPSIIKADIEKNCLFIAFNGFYSAEQIKKTVNQATIEAHKLEAGYTIINDISQLRLTDTKALHELKKLMELAEDDNVTKVVRIVGDNLSKLQLNDATRGASYEVIEVNTLSDAENILQHK